MTKDEAIQETANKALEKCRVHRPRRNYPEIPSEWDLEVTRLVFNAGYDFANRWHVIERDGLPDQDGEYRVTCAGEVFDKPFRFVMDADFKDGNWEFIADVVAWRPMPEPYKEAK